MSSVAYDLGYLVAAQDVFEDYVLSDEIYWSLGAPAPAGQPPYPQLTLGSLYLVRKRIEASSLAQAEAHQYERVRLNLERVEQKWQTAIANKAAREYQARLNLWRDFLDDYRKNPAGHHDRYAYEVQRRVMLALLAEVVGETPEASLNLVIALDRLLRSYFVPGDFIWDAELKSGFPESRYWYLYGAPRSQ